MCNIGTWLYTLINGKLIGNDEFGNRYYESKAATRSFARKHRWVIYNGKAEPSKVPAQWFIWLHYQTNEIPLSNEKTYVWEKEYTPNLTGTPSAYYPKGHALSEGERDKAIGDYQAWRP